MTTLKNILLAEDDANIQQFMNAVKQIGAFWGILNELPVRAGEPRRPVLAGG